MYQCKLILPEFLLLYFLPVRLQSWQFSKLDKSKIINLPLICQKINQKCGIRKIIIKCESKTNRFKTKSSVNEFTMYEGDSLIHIL